MLIRSLGTMAAGIVLSGAVLAGCGTTAPKSAGGGQKPQNTASTKKVSLLETGSTLLYPLFQKWIPVYQASHKNVTITPAGTGSGTGISQALAGTVQIGASDAYMSKAQMKPGILNIPLAISAQVVGYNLPSLNSTHLNLSGAVLAGIYTGKITKWNAPQIQSANPGVTLPNHTIIPVRRSDSSGDSFLFTQYLTRSAPSSWMAGYNTAPNWPAVSNEASAVGNGGMVQALKSNPYSIAYVGISYLNQMLSAGLGYGALQDKNGQYVLPTTSNIVAAANAMVPATPADERVSLIYAPGSSAYPIINYEYAIVQKKQSSAAMASALKTFLTWAISSSGGNQSQFLNAVHFLPLPSSVVSLSRSQIDAIH